MPFTLFRIIKVFFRIAIAALILLFTIDFLLYQYFNSDYSICKNVNTSRSSLCVECDGRTYCWDKHQQIHEDILRENLKEYQERAYECEWDLHYRMPGGKSWKELMAWREERRRVGEERSEGDS